MEEIIEFTYKSAQLRYNPETGQCWKRRKLGSWVLVNPGNLNGKYTRLRISEVTIKLHRILAEVFLNGGQPLAAGQVVDHREHANGSHAQDRLSNLRICSRSENGANRKVNRGTESPYKGITKLKDTGKYRAKLEHQGRIYRLGHFTTPEAAALAYDQKARELFGEFAKLNFDTGSFQ